MKILVGNFYRVKKNTSSGFDAGTIVKVIRTTYVGDEEVKECKGTWQGYKNATFWHRVSDLEEVEK